ncbi:hypothetical protein BACCIP111895_04441 [Neobacillus rhizosphaerae]|uniref:Uncharacterized protein n=1 Tax=Neobacillus rhizosphaerae TaxID=2880965 RepID=A0ABN8KTT4_9BACI|nr:hypothetical protein BACCIP111895_04441 [Neobacillus rhizosphaerae]
MGGAAFLERKYFFLGGIFGIHFARRKDLCMRSSVIKRGKAEVEVRYVGILMQKESKSRSRSALRRHSLTNEDYW